MSATKIKIVVADDESIIIKGICKILSRLDDISEVCGTASNGAQLLKLVQEKKPDLVITDVCMPELSGLDVISRIQDIRPQPMTVIISGYRDFEYAQSAMKCGVKEYLLKPVDPEAIISLVRRRHKDILKEKSINVLENQVYDAEVSNDQAAYYQVVVAKCCDAEREAALEKFCDETMLPQCYTLKYHKDLCIIFSFSCIEDFGGKAFDYANFILENSDERTELYIGDIHKGLNGIYKSYTAASRVFELSFFYKDKRVFSVNDREKICPNSTDDVNKSIDSLCESVKRRNLSGALGELETVTQMILRTSGGIKDVALIHFYSLADKVQFFIREASMQNYSAENMLINLKNCRKYCEIQEYLKGEIIKAVEVIEKNKRMRSDVEIKIVTEYVRSHLSDNITLDTMAGLVHKNTSYFSTFFRKFANENFKDYVMRVKMETALDELKNSDKKISTVAMEVGFADSHHFSKAFKKYFGFTASSVRKE